LERGAAFAQRFDIGRVHDGYAALVEDPDVDVVYVASRQPEHARLAMLSLRAGKSVLVEKPFAMTATEAESVVQVARDSGLFAMEAMWTRYLPQMDVVRQLVSGDGLGDITALSADHGQLIPRDGWRRQPESGGGALLDLGIYPFSFASMVLGKPLSMTVTGTVAVNGVDLQSITVLGYQTAANAIVSTSVLARSPMRASLMGTDGLLEVEAPFFMPSSLTLSPSGFGTPGVSWRDSSDIVGHDGLCYQAAALARFVDAGLRESPLQSLEETVQVMSTLDEVRRRLHTPSRQGSDAAEETAP
jgi:predicted dehydrogenase